MYFMNLINDHVLPFYKIQFTEILKGDNIPDLFSSQMTIYLILNYVLQIFVV